SGRWPARRPIGGRSSRRGRVAVRFRLADGRIRQLLVPGFERCGQRVAERITGRRRVRHRVGRRQPGPVRVPVREDTGRIRRRPWRVTPGAGGAGKSLAGIALGRTRRVTERRIEGLGAVAVRAGRHGPRVATASPLVALPTPPGNPRSQYALMPSLIASPTPSTAIAVFNGLAGTRPTTIGPTLPPIRNPPATRP